MQYWHKISRQIFAKWQMTLCIKPVALPLLQWTQALWWVSLPLGFLIPLCWCINFRNIVTKIAKLWVCQTSLATHLVNRFSHWPSRRCAQVSVMCLDKMYVFMVCLLFVLADSQYRSATASLVTTPCHLPNSHSTLPTSIDVVSMMKIWALGTQSTMFFWCVCWPFLNIHCFHQLPFQHYFAL